MFGCLSNKKLFYLWWKWYTQKLIITMKEKIKIVKQLLNEGLSYRAIGEKLNVHHTTISYWVKNEGKMNDKTIKVNLNTPEYSFILGFYLGDGSISKHARCYKLRLFNDKKYNGINDYIQECLTKIFPDNKNNKCSKTGCWEIYLYNSKLPEYFPQHGRGKKHDRKIYLDGWQEDIVKAHPKEFVKGLIYSDGCIVYNGKNKRYEFSNKSLDIHNILTYALELLCIEKTSTRSKCKSNSDQYITTVSNRSEVEKLGFIIDKW